MSTYVTVRVNKIKSVHLLVCSSQVCVGVPVASVGVSVCSYACECLYVFVSCLGVECEPSISLEYYGPTEQKRKNTDVRKGNHSRNGT